MLSQSNGGGGKCASFAMSIPAIICMLLLVTLALSMNIAELIIGHRYLDDSTNDCHNARLIRPALWLLWDGIIGFIVVSLLLLGAILGQQVTALCVVPAALAQFAWVIIGAVSLWRDNDETCSPDQLHDCVWAVLIIHFVFIGLK